MNPAGKSAAFAIGNSGLFWPRADFYAAFFIGYPSQPTGTALASLNAV